jgi:hypothetical protein
VPKQVADGDLDTQDAVDQHYPPVSGSSGPLKIGYSQKVDSEAEKMAGPGIYSIALTIYTVDLVGRFGRVPVGPALGLLGECVLLLACCRVLGLIVVVPGGRA